MYALVFNPNWRTSLESVCTFGLPSCHGTADQEVVEGKKPFRFKTVCLSNSTTPNTYALPLWKWREGTGDRPKSMPKQRLMVCLVLSESSCFFRSLNSCFFSEPKKLPVQYRRAVIPPNFGTSTGNNVWEFSGVFKEDYYCQYWFLLVLRPNASTQVVTE